MDAVEIAYNSIAVEPIAIKHEKDLIGKATWDFDKPKEMIVRQQSSDRIKLSEDPLTENEVHQRRDIRRGVQGQASCTTREMNYASLADDVLEIGLTDSTMTVKKI